MVKESKSNSNSKSDHSLPPREGGGWVLLFVLSLFVSCHSSPSLSPEEEARRDSAALHVALMPVQDCLPFYVAQRAGIYDSLGLDLRILTLQAQLDTDTAFMRGHVEVAYSDFARAIMMQQDSVSLRAIAAVKGDLYLITDSQHHVRHLGQLRERMVAVARHSITDYWSDRLTDTAKLARADIFRPQINNVRIRTDMLCNSTMDAAFLPEPYASEALLRGNIKNFSTECLSPRLVAFIAPETVLEDSTRNQQIRLLFKGYDIAAEQLRNQKQSALLAVLYKELCLIPDSLIDTLVHSPINMPPLTSPQQADADAALRWLRTRGKVRDEYAADSIISSFSY